MKSSIQINKSQSTVHVRGSIILPSARTTFRLITFKNNRITSSKKRMTLLSLRPNLITVNRLNNLKDREVKPGKIHTSALEIIHQVQTPGDDPQVHRNKQPERSAPNTVANHSHNSDMERVLFGQIQGESRSYTLRHDHGILPVTPLMTNVCG